MNLEQAKVIGFFSLPPASLSETNPTAYNNAWAGAPKGAGTCAHCGTGILHHVIVETPEAGRACIGTVCADKIGGEPQRCAKAKKTSAEMAVLDARNEESRANYLAEMAEYDDFLEARHAKFLDIIKVLKAQGTQFHDSLAEQLVSGSLTYNQARYVAKAMFGRQTKNNQDEYEAVIERCIEEADVTETA